MIQFKPRHPRSNTDNHLIFLTKTTQPQPKRDSIFVRLVLPLICSNLCRQNLHFYCPSSSVLLLHFYIFQSRDWQKRAVIMYHQNSRLGSPTMVLICRIYGHSVVKGIRVGPHHARLWNGASNSNGEDPFNDLSLKWDTTLCQSGTLIFKNPIQSTARGK